MAALVHGPKAELFWRQAPVDQRHGYQVMRRAAERTADPEILVAALVHDVGKAGTPSGAFARSFATVFEALRIPMPSGLAAYRRHGERGADLLAGAGAGELAIDFARRHPDPDPGPHDPGAWHTLLAADHV